MVMVCGPEIGSFRAAPLAIFDLALSRPSIPCHCHTWMELCSETKTPSDSPQVEKLELQMWIGQLYARVGVLRGETWALRHNLFRPGRYPEILLLRPGCRCFVSPGSHVMITTASTSEPHHDR